MVDREVGKAVFVIFALPIYLIGLLSLLLVALLNRYTFKAGFKPGFLIAAILSTLVMVGGHVWLSNDSYWVVIRNSWPLYSIFLGTHTAAYLWFMDEDRYRRFRTVFFT